MNYEQSIMLGLTIFTLLVVRINSKCKWFADTDMIKKIIRTKSVSVEHNFYSG